VVSGVVDRYRGVKLRAVTEANPARLGLRGLDARLVELLRADALTTDELLSRLPLSSDQVRRVVYLLLVTHLALPEGDGASGSSGVRSAVRPQDAQPSSRPLSDGKLAAARAGEAPAPKSPPAIESQQPRTAAQPQVPRSAATPSRPMPASTPAAALPAWQQLVSTRVASASDAGASKVSTPAFAALPVELLDSTGKLRRAEHLAERRSYAEASRILDEVIASEPKNADALAVRAWILFHTSSGADRPSQPLLESIEAALLANQAHPQALYVKGLVLRRMRRENEALRFFQLALDSNPRHIEAARELRLARMRRER
jgi:tetratricopeptide (TPR) repeat protein